MRDEGNLFAGLAALQTGKQPVVDDDGHVEEIRAALVTPNLFTLLGTHMTAGRAFTEEDGAPEAPPPGRRPLRWRPGSRRRARGCRRW